MTRYLNDYDIADRISTDPNQPIGRRVEAIGDLLARPLPVNHRIDLIQIRTILMVEQMEDAA